MKKYEAISKEEREEVEELLVCAIMEQFEKEKVEEEYYQYDVVFQDIHFRTYMTHEELQKAAAYTVDILEEFKVINNTGVNRKKLEKISENANQKVGCEGSELKSVWHAIEVMRQIGTENLEKIVREIAEFRRVGGAYWMIMSQPTFRQALFAVYEVIVDRFEEKEERNWYHISAFFLIRAIMRVRSEEMNEDE